MSTPQKGGDPQHGRLPSDYARDQPERVIRYLVAELQRVRDAGALTAATIIIFSFIDAMTWANVGNRDATPRDFEAWVDKYMADGEPHEYHYRGSQLYKARCAMLHQFAPHDKHPMQFGYATGGPHRHNPTIAADFVILSVEQLADDLWKAVARFIADARGRKDWPLVEHRFYAMYHVMKHDGTSYQDQ